ncbi:DUF554 domain-containing protein [Candidatus Bipolaricaulota bacterium]|nr:DUF554 domain-containing protein [Candidatus Bipolaricaulota bacterium]
MIGTWINMGTVLVGGTVGLLVGERLPERVRKAATGGVGLVTMILGFRMVLESRDVLPLLLAVILGGCVGSWLRLEERLERGSKRVERWFRGYPLAEGFLTASLLFCVGPMTLLGALRDGMFGDWSILGAKAVLDGISSVALAAALGPGVLLSPAVLLVYQGGITLVGRFLVANVGALSPTAPEMVAFSAAGGAVIIALGFEILGWKRVSAVELLPALALAPLFRWVLGFLNI